jgi:hypothetical protein
MKREYPELFKAAGGGKPAPGVNAAWQNSRQQQP